MAIVDGPLAEQWRAAANTLREHAARFDRLAVEAEAAGHTAPSDVVTLLHHIDGQLGLAVHRGEGNQDEWKREADALIGRIRQTIKRLGG